jgi:dTDP-4-amino-4,6-dideoxygalactose transaminase
MIPVTRPFLPPREDYQQYLKGIWERNWLTNNGPLVNELELRLKEYLQAPHLLYVTNGTIALQLAIKALNLRGEIITTPFSYVATTSSIVWEGCTPVFVDINPHTLNIDPQKIEAAVTSQTSAILATHVYGNPCDIDAIQHIAGRHNLKVIYDGAHAFGSRYKGKSVFTYGDVTTASFHATKLFHTVEGGAVFTGDPELLKKMAFMRNFGHNGPEDFAEVGINGKNSEFHAAMGLVNLHWVGAILDSRKQQSLYYDQRFRGLTRQQVAVSAHADFNYAYYPFLFDDEATLIRAVRELEAHRIFPRRYFHPSLDKIGIFSGGEQKTEVSRAASERVLCLPLFFGLSTEEQDMVARLILRAWNYR